MSDNQYVLRLSCPDRPGIVAVVSRHIFDHGGNIREANQFEDEETHRFFMRVAFDFSSEEALEKFEKGFAEIAKQFVMDWTLSASKRLQRVLLLVSKFDHCLVDILYRWKTGELKMNIVGIISNYPIETYSHLEFGDIPFHYLPVTKDTKNTQEAKIWSIVREKAVDVTVLARYMQILSDDLSTKLSGRCINIHHSFLPSFKGGRPYHQAHERGVKIIGATAHYVTADLDEGPIIEQDVERISHQDEPAALVRKGRDIERRVLARALAWHLEGRVLTNGKKTVVFKN